MEKSLKIDFAVASESLRFFYRLLARCFLPLLILLLIVCNLVLLFCV